MKVVTWNVGSYYFLGYAVRRGTSFHGHKIRDIYFQPELNGEFVSSQLAAFDADVVVLQEMHSLDDAAFIPALADYPYKTLVPNIHHEHSVLVASKQPFEITTKGDYACIGIGEVTLVPVHLDAHSAQARYADTKALSIATAGITPLIIIGDTNIWSRGKRCVFPADKRAYATLTRNLTDITTEFSSTSYFGLAFDKAFISSDLVVKHVSCPHVRSYFMDHYPLVVEFTA